MLHVASCVWRTKAWSSDTFGDLTDLRGFFCLEDSASWEERVNTAVVTTMETRRRTAKKTEQLRALANVRKVVNARGARERESRYKPCAGGEGGGASACRHTHTHTHTHTHPTCAGRM